MSKRGKDMEAAIEDELYKQGITRFSIERTNGHSKLTMYVDGKTRLYGFGATPSDVRANKNTIRDLRRIIREARA